MKTCLECRWWAWREDEGGEICVWSKEQTKVPHWLRHLENYTPQIMYITDSTKPRECEAWEPATNLNFTL